MKKQIEIHYPKTLTLNNVVQTRAADASARGCVETATKITQFIRNCGAVPVGPLVQMIQEPVRGQQSSRSGPHFLRQARGRIENKSSTFIATPQISHSGCVMAKFEGDPIDLPIVFGKIAVFAYENELELAGTAFVVFVAEDNLLLTADVFAAIAGEH